MTRLPRLGRLVLALLLPCSAMAQTPDSTADDPFLWLEDVTGDASMAWVRAHNAETLSALEARPEFAGHVDRALAVLTTDDRIAVPAIRGAHVYNVWTDAEHPRGLWRRATLDAYLADAPDWETVLDIGALGTAEGVNWSWGGATCLEPDYARCLVTLSRGGSDAGEVREFDTVTKQFVAGGFRLPEAKSALAWISPDEVLVATDFGPDADGIATMTDSGYPRVVKRWRRGTPLTAAETVFEAQTTDMGAWPMAVVSGDRRIPGVSFRPSFFEGTVSILQGDALVPLDLPLDADPSLAGDRLVVYLRSPWTVGDATYPAGAVLSANFDAFVAGARAFETAFVPTDRQTVQSVATLGPDLLVSVLDTVRGHLLRLSPEGDGWQTARIDAPDLSSVDVVTTDDATGRFFFTTSSYLQPTTLYVSDEAGVRAVKALPAQFDASGLVTEQHEAVSADGTRVPYFLVHTEGLALDGTAPTLLYGYGGFEVSLEPGYEAMTGAEWLATGGVYAVANIRGGGEFGPQWHRAAMRENRPRAFEDFIAVAEALVSTGVTSPQHLGIRGGSNGGLLMGAMLTQRPDLFNAVVIQVPLLDMLRYHTLLAGASWMAEYGDPDVPADRAFIERYSPYQNLHAGTAYPVPLFTTTTRDDRVHPGHARKMAARMESMGLPVYYFENTEGGHGAGVTPEQQARTWATVYTYLDLRLR